MNPILTKNNNLLIPYLRIHPTYSIIYYAPEVRKGRSKEQNEQFEKASKKEKFTGILSQNSQNKIRNIVNWLTALSEWKKIEIDGKKVFSKLSFITLTLPSKQVHSDNEIKEICLNQLLVELKQKHKDFMYIWKAEKQKNGNIHFHLTTNIQLHYADLQTQWNRIINKLNYVDTYSANMKLKYKNGFFFDVELFQKYGIKRELQFERYKKALSTGFRQPHSTEIKAVRNIRNIAAYISEYIAKTDENSEHKITGRIYGCSKALESLNITIPLENYDIDFNRFKLKNNDFTTIVLANVLELAATELQNEIANQLIKQLNLN